MEMLLLWMAGASAGALIEAAACRRFDDLDCVATVVLFLIVVGLLLT